MNDNQKDPNLSTPQESNTTKHINFLEAEENAANNAGGDSNAEADEDKSPTQKKWEEMRKDNNE